jgi:predicted nucleotidyltransferase
MGKVSAPKRHRRPPSREEIARILETYCLEKGITHLKLFGSVARGEARQGSDVDLIATFDPARRPHGLAFFAVPDEMAALLGVPVDLLTRETVEAMTNPYRKNSILADAREILST